MPIRNRVLPLIVILMAAGCACKPKDQLDPVALQSSFMSVVETLAAPEMEGRGAGTEGLAKSRDYLVERFRQAGLKPAFEIDGEPSYTQPFEIKIGADEYGEPVMATVENVGALLPGSGSLADQVVVIGAHYDHVGYGEVGSRAKDRRGEIHPGADDNASGTAAVVILGNIQAGVANTLGGARRTIMFTCFAGEERGLLGSKYMTTHTGQWAFDSQQVVAMINMDMIGRLREGKLGVYTDATGEQWRDWTNCENKTAGLDLLWDERAPGGSDHTPFINIGVPSIFFNTGLHETYHTPDDTPDTLNALGGARVIALVGGLLERVVTEPQRLVYVKPPPRQPRPYMGAQLQEHEAGVLIARAIKDGPIYKAGARDGDVLLSLGGEPTGSVRAVQRLLMQTKPGQPTKVIVLRANKQIELTFEPGKR